MGNWVVENNQECGQRFNEDAYQSTIENCGGRLKYPMIRVKVWCLYVKEYMQLFKSMSKIAILFHSK